MTSECIICLCKIIKTSKVIGYNCPNCEVASIFHAKCIRKYRTQYSKDCLICKKEILKKELFTNNKNLCCN